MAKRKRRCDTSQQNTRAKRQLPETVEDVALSMKIDDINIDCLEHVFNYLSLMDLINVADANKYLGRAAALVFARRSRGKMVEIMFSYFHIPALQPLKLTDESIVIQKPKSAFRILRLFGEYISKIMMNGTSSRQFNSPLSTYVNKYCSETLISIKIKINAENKRGRKLKFVDAEKPFTIVEEVLSFKHLKECTIDGRLDYTWIDFVINYPTIEKLSITEHSIKTYFHIDEENMLKIATSLPTLTELSMYGWLCTVDTVIRFLNESKTLRRFSMEFYNERDIIGICSSVTSEWNATKHSKLIVIERK